MDGATPTGPRSSAGDRAPAGDRASAAIAAIAVVAWRAVDPRRRRRRGATTGATAVSPETSAERRRDDARASWSTRSCCSASTAPTPRRAFVDELRARQLGGVLVARRELDRRGDRDARWSGRSRAAGASEGRIPPLIVAAQEGGAYRAFADLPPEQTELEIGDGGSIARRRGLGARDRRGAARAPASTSTCSRSPTSRRSTARSPTAPSPTTRRRSPS